jgi:hypothetical protein
MKRGLKLKLNLLGCAGEDHIYIYFGFRGGEHIKKKHKADKRQNKQRPKFKYLSLTHTRTEGRAPV